MEKASGGAQAFVVPVLHIPLTSIAQSFVDLAAISALAADGEGCSRALKELPDYDTFSPKKDDRWNPTSLWAGCSWLAFQSSWGQAGEQPGIQPGSSVVDQINEVVRSGKYSALPDPQIISTANGNGSPIIQFKNSTAYNLTVLCSGPSERSIQVGPGQSSSIKLEAGNYRMMGRVETPSVLPLYKEFRFENATYSINFYLTPR